MAAVARSMFRRPNGDIINRERRLNGYGKRDREIIYEKRKKTGSRNEPVGTPLQRRIGGLCIIDTDFRTACGRQSDVLNRLHRSNMLILCVVVIFRLLKISENFFAKKMDIKSTLVKKIFLRT